MNEEQVKDDAVVVAGKPEPSADVMQEALYTDIALLVLAGGANRKQIAERVGMSSRNLRRVMADPAFIAVFNALKGTLYGSLEEILKNEKADPLMRAEALSRRGQTLLAETLEVLQSRIDEHREATVEGNRDNRLKATELKVLVEAAIGAMDRSARTTNAAGSSGGQNVNIAIFKPNEAQARIMQEAMEESFIDAEVVEDDSDGAEHA